MGDILLASPLIRCLRRRFPQAEIHFAARERFQGLLEGSPHLNEILYLPEPAKFRQLREFAAEKIRPAGYDITVDIHSSLRSRYVCAAAGGKIFRWKPPRFQRWLLVKFKLNRLKNAPPVPLGYLEAVKSLGVEDDGGGLEFHIPHSAVVKSDEIWLNAGFSGKKIAALAPGAVWRNKQWGREKFAETGRRLLETSRFQGLVILGSAEESTLCREIADGAGEKALNLAGSADFKLAGAVMRKCSLFIGNDSGLAHLAAAVGTPSIVIFGPTVEEFGFFPFRRRSAVVQKDLPCRPCSHLGGDVCPEKHFRCLEDIDVEEIVSAIDKLMMNA